MTVAKQTNESFEDWIKRLSTEVDRLTDLSTTSSDEAAAVFLPHQKTGTLARATQDGICMFDPVAGKPVISIGGAWKEFTITP